MTTVQDLKNIAQLIVDSVNNIGQVGSGTTSYTEGGGAVTEKAGIGLVYLDENNLPIFISVLSGLPISIPDAEGNNLGTSLNPFIIDLAGALSENGDSIRATKQGSLTDRSNNDIDTVSESLMGASATRRYLFMMAHPDNTGTVWINFTDDATTDSPSIPLVAGAGLVFEGSFVTTQAVNVIASAANQKLIAKEG